MSTARTHANTPCSEAFALLSLSNDEREMMYHLMSLVAHIRLTATRIAITDFMFAQTRPQSPFGGPRLFRRSYDAPSWSEIRENVVDLISELPAIDYDTEPNGYTIRELIRAYPALRQLRDAAVQTSGAPKLTSIRHDTTTAMRLLKRLYRYSDYTRLAKGTTND